MIDVGAATWHVLSNIKVSVEKKKKLPKECITFVLNILLKLQEHSPIQYAVVKSVLAISPVNMAEENRLMPRGFHLSANDLHSLNFIASSMADSAKFQYDKFLKKEVPKNRDKFLEFDMRKDPVDEFLSV